MKRFNLILLSTIVFFPIFSMGQSLNPVKNLRYSEWCYNFNFLWDEPDSSGNTFIQYLVYEDSILIDSTTQRFYTKEFDQGEHIISVSVKYLEGESVLINVDISVPLSKRPSNPYIENRKDYFYFSWGYPYYRFEADYVEDYTPPYFTYYNYFYDSITYAIKYSWPANDDFVAEVTSVRFFPSDEHGQGLEYHLKIFQGNDDPQLMYFSNIEEIAYNEWNTIEIDPPLILEANEDVWFGITIISDVGNSNFGGIGLDDFWPNPGNNGGLWSSDEIHWSVESGGDWCISGYYTNALYYAKDEINKSRTPSVLVNYYNIYKNGEFLASTTDEFYADYDFSQEDCNEYFEYGIETVYNNCISDTVAVGDTLICSTYIGEHEIKSLDISPNPAIEFINCQLPSHDRRYFIVIYNLYGILIFEKPVQKSGLQLQIDVSSYPAGIYIAVLKNDKGILGRRKFVVK